MKTKLLENFWQLHSRLLVMMMISGAVTEMGNWISSTNIWVMEAPKGKPPITKTDEFSGKFQKEGGGGISDQKNNIAKFPLYWGYIWRANVNVSPKNRNMILWWMKTRGGGREDQGPIGTFRKFISFRWGEAPKTFHWVLHIFTRPARSPKSSNSSFLYSV